MEGDDRLWSEEAEVSALGAPFAVSTKEDGDGEKPDWSEAVAEVVNALVENLQEEDFYAEHHRLLYGAIRRVHERGEPVDVVTVSDELKASGDLEAAGGMAYLAQLVDAVPTAANLEAHVQVLRRHRGRREIAQACREVVDGSTGSRPVEETIAGLRDRLTRVERLAAVGDGLEGVDRLTLREALEDPSLLDPPEPVLEGLAHTSQSTMLVAGPKDGKTTLLLSAGAAVSRGEPWLGSPTRQGYVVWLMGEGDRGQILRGFHRFGADPDAVEAIVAGANPVEEFRRVVENLKPRMVVIDTWNTWSSLLGLDNWKESEVAPVLRRIERIVRESGVALVLIHHTRKADDEPMGSQALKGWADVVRILKPGDGPRERKVVGPARFPVPDLHYRLVDDGESVRVEAVDPDREIEEKVLEFLEVNPGASKRSIREGVDGRNSTIEDAIGTLVSDGIVEVDTSGRSHAHRIAGNPRGHATGTVRARSGHGSEANEPDTVPERVPPSHREGDTGARSDESSVEPNRCEGCGTKIGPTSDLCGACKREEGAA